MADTTTTEVTMSEPIAEEVSKKRTEPDSREVEEPSAKRAKTADETPKPVKSVEDQLREQLEYYFGEANYPTDKWMNITASENGGYIPLASFGNFPRIKKLIEGQDSDIIVKAIKSSGELELDETETKVKRKIPLDETTDLIARSIHVSKLPQDAEAVTIDSVKEFFSQFAPVISVRVHKSVKDKSTVSGTAAVTFKTVEDKEKVLALPEIKWGENVIKVADKAAADAAFREKRAKKGDKAEKTEKSDDAPAAPAWERGLILKLTKFGGDIDAMKTKFGEFGFVKFVDIIGGPNNTRKIEVEGEATEEAPVAYVRFAEAEKATAALAAVQKKEVTIADVEVEGSLLEGDAEEEYWVKNIISAKPSGGKRGGRGGKRGGRGGRGGRRGRN